MKESLSLRIANDSQTRNISCMNFLMKSQHTLTAKINIHVVKAIDSYNFQITI